jgi:hypothetical protein
MGLQHSITSVTQLADGIWAAPLTPAEVRSLGGCRLNQGRRSIVATAGPQFNEATSQLSISPGTTLVLNVGTDDQTLILDLKLSAGDRVTRKQMGSLPGRGDGAFFAACERELEPGLAHLAKELLGQVRAHLPGELHEGLARKWVNSPLNCLAITIQPRDGSLAIHVKGNPDDFGPCSLTIKSDRPSYSRFKINSPDQLGEAIRVVLASARCAEPSLDML